MQQVPRCDKFGGAGRTGASPGCPHSSVHWGIAQTSFQISADESGKNDSGPKSLLAIVWMVDIWAAAQYYDIGSVTDPPVRLPRIDPHHSTNVTALAGQTTVLNCRVHGLGNRRFTNTTAAVGGLVLVLSSFFIILWPVRAILSSSLRLFSILIAQPVCGGESLYRTVSWIRQDSLHLLTVSSAAPHCAALCTGGALHLHLGPALGGSPQPALAGLGSQVRALQQFRITCALPTSPAGCRERSRATAGCTSARSPPHPSSPGTSGWPSSVGGMRAHKQYNAK